MTVDSILSVLGTLAGALMGWGLSEFSKKRAARPNVVFGLCGTPEDKVFVYGTGNQGDSPLCIRKQH